MKKYELTNNKEVLKDGTIVYQIKALKDFGEGDYLVKAGDLGGYIEKESNLSQEGECWIFSGIVTGNNTVISGNIKIIGKVFIDGHYRYYKSESKIIIRGSASLSNSGSDSGSFNINNTCFNYKKTLYFSIRKNLNLLMLNQIR